MLYDTDRLSLKSDIAENSVMQTITVAVSAIMIAAGMVTIPNVINNNKDAQVTSDLKNISLSENYRAANTGAYVEDLSVIKTQNGNRINLTPGSWTKVKLNNTIGYGIMGISSTGRVWVMNPKINKPVYVGTVKFNGSGGAQTVKAGSFLPRTDSGASAATAKFTNSGFVTGDVYTATKNQ